MKTIGTILVCLLAATVAFGQGTGAIPPAWWGSSTQPATTLGYINGANGLNVWSEPTEIVINFAAAGAWDEAASTHEVLNVTGDVEIEMAIACSTNVSSTSSDSLWFFLGESGATGYRMFSALAEDIDAGEALIPVNYSGRGYIWSAAALSTTAGGTIHFMSHMGKDVGYDIDDHDFTGGILTVWYRWRPLSTGGSVSSASGAGL